MADQLVAAMPGQHEIVVGGTAGDEIRSEFLRWFILEAIPSTIARFEAMRRSRANLICVDQASQF
jgi:hypothetical protein